MLEILIKPAEKDMRILNNTNEDYSQVTIHYCCDGKKRGKFSQNVLPAQSLIRWEEESLLNHTIEVDTLAVTTDGVLLQHFSGIVEKGNLAIISLELIPKREIVKLVFSDLYSFQASESSKLLEGKEVLKDFVNLLFAYIDTEYRENEEKMNYRHYLHNEKGVQFVQSEGTDILLAKCITLMEFLSLDEEEMAIYFLEITS